MPPPLSHREQALASLNQPQQGGRGGGMDLGAIMGMLTHLYGLQQQQAQAPGQLQHQNLQNQLDQWHLQNDPLEFQQKQAFQQAQIDQLHDKGNDVHLPVGFDLLDAPTKEAILDQQIPGRAQNRMNAAQAENTKKWNTTAAMATTVKDSPQIHALNTASWGPQNADWLAQMYQAPPSPPTHYGQQIHDAVTGFPSALGASVNSKMNSGVQFTSDLLGKPDWLGPMANGNVDYAGPSWNAAVQNAGQLMYDLNKPPDKVYHRLPLSATTPPTPPPPEWYPRNGTPTTR